MKKSYIILISIAVLISLIVGGLIVAYFAITADTELDMTLLNEPKSTVILDEQGRTVDSGKKYVKKGEIAPSVIKAFIAIEDTRFYQHNGIDFYRIMGATAKNITKFKAAEGASTITQQLIKNTHLTNEKSISRKIKEIKLAKQLEKKISKDEILEKYLNAIYFGNGFYGIAEASQGYFQKSPYELNIAESAILAGTVKSPNNYNPISDSEASIKRMKTVLSAMQKNEFITENELNSANSYKYKPNYGYNQNNYSQSYSKIAKYQASQILKSINADENMLSSKNLIIETYMNDNMQRNCYSRLVASLNSIDNAGGTICIGDNNGVKLIAYASTESYPYSRQVGSVMKPFSVYAPALELNYANAATQILDEATDFGGYKPSNYGGVTHGYVSLRESVKHSYNIPAVKLLNDIGINSVLPFLDKLDISVNEKEKNLSLALGSNSTTPLNLLSCYSTLANYGNYMPTNAIKRIRTDDNKILYTDNRFQRNVFRDDTAFIMTDILRDTAMSGTASKLKYLNIDIAAKTGTVGDENGNTDAYTVAYTPENTFLAWFGSKDGQMDSKITGGTYPTIAIKNVIENIRNYSPSKFRVPDSVVSVPIDKDRLTNCQEIVYSALGEPEYFSRFTAPKAPIDNININRNKSIFDKIRIIFGH